MCGSCSMSPLSGKQIKNKLKYLLDCCWASVIKSTERRKDVFFFFLEQTKIIKRERTNRHKTSCKFTPFRSAAAVMCYVRTFKKHFRLLSIQVRYSKRFKYYYNSFIEWSFGVKTMNCIVPDSTQAGDLPPFFPSCFLPSSHCCCQINSYLFIHSYTLELPRINTTFLLWLLFY